MSAQHLAVRRDANGYGCGTGRLLAAGMVVMLTALPAAAVTLDWSTVVWTDGDLTNTYTLGGVDVTITFSTGASGTLSPAGFPDTPYEDGPLPPASDFNFGCCLDLGVIFDPDAAQGTSPIVITLEFEDSGTMTPTDVTDLSFEISDIDFSPFGGGQDPRIDQVVITSNAGDPTLAAKTLTPSFTISGNTATSDGSAEVFAGSDNATVIVDFGATPVQTVTITYNEVSGNDNPGFRGIGLFFDTQFNADNPAVQLVKTAGGAADGEALVTTLPDTITYSYEVTNTGNTHLSDMVIVDDRGTPDPGDDVTLTSVECPALAGPLAPGDSFTCTADILVTVDTTNLATVTGNPTDELGDDLPDEEDVTDDDPAVVVRNLLEIPTLGEWGLLLLALTLGAAGLWLAGRGQLLGS